ncbi:MAG: putative ATPase [Sulfurimonas sp.]|jgi:predicted ATPase
MELVYLWVEKYKNIENQGFNFSPRFKCDFDEKTKELKIDEKKDYVSIFPENINITAIVGENGSGKSSISEILGIFTYTEDLENSSFLVFFDGVNFLFKKYCTGGNIFFKVTNNTDFAYKDKYIHKQVFAKYFANELSTFFNNNSLYSEQLKVFDEFNAYYEYKTPMMENNQLSVKSEIKNKYDMFNNRFLNLLKGNKNTFDFIDENFMFDRYKNELHLYDFGVLINKELFLKLIGGKLQTYTIFEENNSNPEIILFKFFILYKLFLKQDLPDFDNKIFEDIKSDFEILNSIDDYEDIIKLIDDNEIIFKKENVQEIIDIFEYKDKEIWREKNSHNIKNIKSSNNPLLVMLIENLNRPYIYNSKNENYNFLALSSGEKEYLYIFTYFIYHLRKSDERKFVYIFDEPDLGLHPNLQKKLVRDMIKCIDIYYYISTENSLQLIITSHSPFILSDLPKENVVFLKKDENGNCKNVTQETNIETFGANIHTLLSHGFFMDDGLMGEFAKDKIDEVIKYLKPDKQSTIKDDKEAKNIIDIIGEPILKNTLQTMYNDKVYKDESKLDKLKRKQEELQYEIDKIEGKTNEKD